MLLFGIFFASWVVMRLIYFPFVVIRSTLTEPITLVGRPYGIEPMPHYAIFNGLLLVLLVLHIYWCVDLKSLMMRGFECNVV